MKFRKIITPSILAALAAGYFAAFSQIEVPFFIKGYVAIIPLQALALIYVGYFYYCKRKSHRA